MADKEVGFTLKVNGTDKAVKSINDVEQALVELQKEAKTMDLGSAEFEKVQGEMRKAQAQLKEFRADTKKVKEVKDQFTDMGSGIGNSMNLAEDSLRAFGIESKGLSTIVQVSNAIITATNGIRAASESKVEQSVARKAIVEKAAAMATKTWTAIQAAFNAVLAMNPIGLVVIAIAALVAGIVLLWSPIKKLTDNFKFLGDAVDYVWGLMRDFASWISGGAIDDAATNKTRENADKIAEGFNNIESAQNVAMRKGEEYITHLKNMGASEEVIVAKQKELANQRIDAARKVVLAYQALIDAGKKLTDEEQESFKKAQATMREGKLAIQAIDDAATKERLEKQKAASQKAAAEHKAYYENLKGITKEANSNAIKILEEAFLLSIQDQRKREEATLALATKSSIDILAAKAKAIFESGKLDKAKNDAIEALAGEALAIEKRAAEQLSNMRAKWDAEDLAKKQEADAKKIADEKKTADELYNLMISQRDFETSLMADKVAQEEQLRQNKYNDDIAALQKLYTDKETLNQMILLLDQEYAIESARIAKENADEKIAIAQAAYEAKMNIVNAEIELLAGLGRFLTEISGKSKALAIAGLLMEKAAAIGHIIVNTMIANSKAIAASPLTAGMPWVAINTAAGILEGALVVASTVKAINEIRNSGKGESSSSEGGGTPSKASKFSQGGSVRGPGTGISDSIPTMLSDGESVMNANTTKMFGGILSTLNQAGGGKPLEGVENQGGQSILKAYVVSSEMTSDQEKNKKIKDLARI